MRCPKCQYISFEQAGRCRNCGYDFSLAPDEPDADLLIQDGSEPLGPMADLALAGPVEILPESASGAGRVMARTPTTGSLDLPLFKQRLDDDAPLVTPSAVPRVPLSVRRGAPAVPSKPRRRSREATAPKLALETAEIPIVPEWPAPVPDRSYRDLEEAAADVPESEAVPGAPIARRLAAATVDGIIMGAVDAGVIYLTLRVCELPVSELARLPIAPMLAFVLLMNGGYVAGFTASGGQTIGKMATGLRVVSAAPGFVTRVTLGNAILRAAAYLASAMPVGLGFLPGLLGTERRTLHDRLADTRVIKA